MRPARFSLLSLVAAPALASCAFILDFDSLQSEKDTPAQGGQLLTGGSAGTAGIAGGEQAGQGGSAPTDVCEGVTGLVQDGLDVTENQARQYRVTAVGGSDDFFLSVLLDSDEGRDTALYRVRAESSDLELVTVMGSSSTNSQGRAVSAAGLAFQESDGDGLLHTFVAMERRSGEGARVWRAIIKTSTLEMLMLPAQISESYWDVSPYNHPIATTLDGVVTTAWINQDQSISLDGGGLSRRATLSTDTQATALGVVASDQDEPGVLYSSSTGVFVERPGEAPIPVEECQAAPGAFLSLSTSYTGVPGFWIGAWTKFGPATDDNEAFLTTEGLGLYCGADGACALQARDCSSSVRNNLVRNPVTSVIHRPDSRTGLVEVVQARPQLVLADDGETVVAQLVLTQDSVDFGVPPLSMDPESEPLGPPIELSAMETSEEEALAGPDWPVIAYVPPDRYLVAWIEPGASGGDDLRVQRYRMCPP